MDVSEKQSEPRAPIARVTNRSRHPLSVRTRFPADRFVQESICSSDPPPPTTTIATSSGSCSLAQDSPKELTPRNQGESCAYGVNRQQSEERTGEIISAAYPEDRVRLSDMLKMSSQRRKADVENEELNRSRREEEALEQQQQSQERIADADNEAEKKEDAESLTTQKQKSGVKKMSVKLRKAGFKIWKKLKNILP